MLGTSAQVVVPKIAMEAVVSSGGGATGVTPMLRSRPVRNPGHRRMQQHEVANPTKRSQTRSGDAHMAAGNRQQRLSGLSGSDSLVRGSGVEGKDRGSLPSTSGGGSMTDGRRWGVRDRSVGYWGGGGGIGYGAGTGGATGGRRGQAVTTALQRRMGGGFVRSRDKLCVGGGASALGGGGDETTTRGRANDDTGTPGMTDPWQPAPSTLPPLLRMPTSRAALHVGSPVMAMGLLRSAFNLTDAYWAGKLGPSHLSALCYNAFALWIICLACSVVATGVQARVSAHVGAGNDKVRVRVLS